MQVIGLCRFSYPALGGFQVNHASVEAREAFLYEPARMARRFAMFETFTLPGLRAQTDADFTYLIVTGHSLPAPYLRRLRDLTKDMPQVVIQQHPPGPHRAVMKGAINSVKTPSKAPSLQFRLDDDDAVARTFVQQLRKKAAQLAPLLEDYRTLAIDFNQGLVATPSAEGIVAQEISRPYWTPALALMATPAVSNTVMNFSHHKISQHMPTATFTGDAMFVRGINELNDSRQKPAVQQHDMKPLSRAQEIDLAQRFNIQADEVRRVFSAL